VNQLVHRQCAVYFLCAPLDSAGNPSVSSKSPSG
jgi:hypothetical protein